MSPVIVRLSGLALISQVSEPKGPSRSPGAPRCVSLPQLGSQEVAEAVMLVEFGVSTATARIEPAHPW